jgi:2-hydroxychromene-2-carboxylate isomerase
VGEPRAEFFYDFGSPYAYLAAERVEEVLGEAVAWSPIFLVGVFKATGRRSWVYTEEAERDWAEVRRRLAERGLPPLRLCDGWADRLIPSRTPARSTLLAQRAATAAADARRLREFSLALCRLEFAEGRDLTDEATMVEAGEQAGVGADALRAALADDSRRDRVRAATGAAVARGVSGVPTIAVGERLFWGDDRLDEAAAALHSASDSR